MLAKRYLAVFGAALLMVCAQYVRPGHAQEWSGQEGSTQGGPTLDEYLKEAGPDAKLIAYGELKIDGKAVNCGKRLPHPQHQEDHRALHPGEALCLFP